MRIKGQLPPHHSTGDGARSRHFLPTDGDDSVHSHDAHVPLTDTVTYIKVMTQYTHSAVRKLHERRSLHWHMYVG